MKDQIAVKQKELDKLYDAVREFQDKLKSYNINYWQNLNNTKIVEGWREGVYYCDPSQRQYIFSRYSRSRKLRVYVWSSGQHAWKGAYNNKHATQWGSVPYYHMCGLADGWEGSVDLEQDIDYECGIMDRYNTDNWTFLKDGIRFGDIMLDLPDRAYLSTWWKPGVNSHSDIWLASNASGANSLNEHSGVLLTWINELYSKVPRSITGLENEIIDLQDKIKEEELRMP